LIPAAPHREHVRQAPGIGRGLVAVGLPAEDEGVLEAGDQVGGAPELDQRGRLLGIAGLLAGERDVDGQGGEPEGGVVVDEDPPRRRGQRVGAEADRSHRHRRGGGVALHIDRQELRGHAGPLGLLLHDLVGAAPLFVGPSEIAGVPVHIWSPGCLRGGGEILVGALS
jgi:hypothetical protein